MPTSHPLQIGDIVHVSGDRDLWKITAIIPRGRGQQITATSLNAYPRIDTTVPASRVTSAHQE